MNICEIKMKSTHIPKGKIMPAWVIKIVKGNKKQSCRITSLGCYVYRLPKGGLLLFPEASAQNHCMTMVNTKNVTLEINPYGGIYGGMFSFLDGVINAAAAKILKHKSTTKLENSK